DGRGTVAFGAAMDQRVGEALVRQQPCRDELVEQGLDLLGGLGMRRQFAREFGSAVLAPRQQAKRACLQRQGTLGTPGAAAAFAGASASSPAAWHFQAAASSGAAPRAATP